MNHILSIEQSFLTKGEGVAICSCGARSAVEGGGSVDLLHLGEIWHAEHTLKVGGTQVAFSDVTDRP